MPTGGLFKDCTRPKIKNYNCISVMKKQPGIQCYHSRIGSVKGYWISRPNPDFWDDFDESREYNGLFSPLWIPSFSKAHYFRLSVPLERSTKKKYTAPITPIYYWQTWRFQSLWHPFRNRDTLENHQSLSSTASSTFFLKLDVFDWDACDWLIMANNPHM